MIPFIEMYVSCESEVMVIMLHLTQSQHNFFLTTWHPIRIEISVSEIHVSRKDENSEQKVKINTDLR